MSELQDEKTFSLSKNIPDFNADELAKLLCVDRLCIFVILENSGAKDDSALISRTRTLLREFNLLAEKDLNFFDSQNSPGTPQSYYVFAVQCKAVERCRDRLKEIFFEVYLQTASPETIFDLSKYLTFISPSKKIQGELIERTFVHGIGRFYRFIFNPKKIVINAGHLNQFLGGLPQNCPNHLFLSGPKASKGDWALPVINNPIKVCDLTELAKRSSDIKLMKRAHENIEKFLMLHDPKTFACEVPIWLQPSDFSDYEARFRTTACITGHIDILRLEENGQLGLWDYKPNAIKEKTAAQQVFFYMMMLSKRTGIPIERISGGYFDEHDAFSVHQP